MPMRGYKFYHGVFNSTDISRVCVVGIKNSVYYTGEFSNFLKISEHFLKIC